MLLILFLLLVLSYCCSATNAVVSLQLNAIWPHTSLTQEAIEFVSDVSNDDVLSALHILHAAEADSNPKDFLTALNQFLFKSPYTGPLMDLSISNKLYSAHVEFQRTLERRLQIQLPAPSHCGQTFAVVCRQEERLNEFSVKRICTEADIGSWKTSSWDIVADGSGAGCRLFQFEHFLKRSSKKLSTSTTIYHPSEEHLIIYSPLETKSDVALVLELVEAFNFFTVVFRHADSSSCRPDSVDPRPFCSIRKCCHDHLGLYAAELAVKSNEYRTVDDAVVPETKSMIKMESANDFEADSLDEDEEATHSSAAVMDSDSINETVLSEQKIRQLGVQAVTRIVRSGGIRQGALGRAHFDAWIDLVSNFPGEVSQLSHSFVPGSVHTSIRRLRSRLVERASAITVDGNMLSQDPSVLFTTALNPIASKLLAIEAAVRAGVSVPNAVKLMGHLRAEADEQPEPLRRQVIPDALPCRLDWRGAGGGPAQVPLLPVWDVLNNDETSKWSSDAERLMMVILMGAHNNVIQFKGQLFHMLAVFDSLDVNQIGRVLDLMKLKAAPRIVYLIPYVSLTGMSDDYVLTRKAGNDNLRSIIAEYFFRLATPDSSTGFQGAAKAATSFLEKIQSLLRRDDDLSINEIKAAYKDVSGVTDMPEGVSLGRQTAEYVADKGLSPNILIINGRVLRLRSVNENIGFPSRTGKETTVKFSDIISMVEAQELQQIVSLLMFGRSLNEVENSADLLLSSKTSSPTCLLPPNAFIEGRARRPDICEVVLLDRRDAETVAQPVSGLNWENSDTNDLAGSFSVRLDQFVRPEAVKQFPTVLTTDGKFPIHITVIPMAFTVENLKVLSMVLSHSARILQNETYLAKSFPAMTWQFTLRFGAFSSNSTPFWNVVPLVLTFGSKLPTDRLKLLRVLISDVVTHGMLWDMSQILQRLSQLCEQHFFDQDYCQRLVTRSLEEPSVFSESLPFHLLNDSLNVILNSQLIPLIESSRHLGFLELQLLGAHVPLLPHVPSDVSPDCLQFALALRQKVAPTEVWSGPADIYNAAPGLLKVHLPPPVDKLPPPVTVFGILDPLSRRTQSWLPVLQVLNDVLNVEVNLVMNPSESIKEYPINRWFRQVIHPPTILSFSHYNNTSATTSIFSHLETKHILTAGLHVPDRWLVRPSIAIQDLDNILPGQEVKAEFILSDIFFEGQAKSENQPTGALAGLQLELTPDPPSLNLQASILHDTFVMGNLGYFQLRGSPGLFWVHTSGHSQHPQEVYAITSLDGATAVKGSNDVATASPVIINSLLGGFHQLNVVKLDIADRRGVPESKLKGGNWDVRKFFDQLLNRYWTVKLSSECRDMIHVFSLASGHMYERLLRIMILSVRRHTKCPLTFWFVDNFLSPKFKQIMPAMAKQYNVTYNFVTYNWPAWLIRQTEKQRQIWAYKILFLDVLFPKDITRIIYIDADQIVRADIRQLWDINLQGKVYGFTPFCDSNPDTEEFRFWKQGYWKNHLNGKPYHISALFVVDLKRFRETGAADYLRGVYNQLSRDKDSLANLDQDLPNFAQNDIPIFPLPEDWLWCETWCSTSRLASAKTIDLCNNPLTKEPKLSQARRIAHEWEQYDQEIRNLELSVEPAEKTSENGQSTKDEL